jgi:hypothetical protein
MLAREYRRVWHGQSLRLLNDLALMWGMVEEAGVILADVAANQASWTDLKDFRATIEPMMSGDPADVKKVAQLVSRPADVLRRKTNGDGETRLVLTDFDASTMRARVQFGLLTRLRARVGAHPNPEALVIALHGTVAPKLVAEIEELMARPNAFDYLTHLKTPVLQPSSVLHDVAYALSTVKPERRFANSQELFLDIKSVLADNRDLSSVPFDDVWDIAEHANLIEGNGRQYAMATSVVGNSQEVLRHVILCYAEEVATLGMKVDADVIADLVLEDRLDPDHRTWVAEVVQGGR